MFSLAFVSFVAGILTILAPCVLPVLPVILAGSLSEKGKWYPYIITASLAVSIVLFTIILKASTLFIMVPPSFWTTFSSVILILLGLTYVFPHIWSRITTFLHFDRSSQTLDTTQNIESSTLRAIVTGAALGPVFSSCSPTYSLLLATVFPVSFLAGIGYTILYALGLAWMLLIIARGGRTVITKLRIFADERGYFRKSLGVLLILIGLFIVSGYEQKVESALLARYNVNSTEQSILDRFIPPLVRRNMAPTSQTVNLPVSHSGTKIAPPFPLSITNPFRAPELTGLTDWINSDPLTLEQLKGKVVLIDFWTYSCINCQRTLPYLKAWDAKYRDKGLIIIGVHAPEFAFEHLRSNVEKAVNDIGIKYPVALDNDFTVWNAYQNQYWPAKYFIDREGNLRHYHFGEGEYAESEQVIQYLLAEGQGSPVATGSVSESIPTELNQGMGQSPETYLGTERRSHLVVGSERLGAHEWSLGGDWKDSKQSIRSGKKSTLKYHFSARDVYLVLGGSGTVSVKVDGKIQYPSTDVHDGKITVNTDRMYHLVHAPSFLSDGLLELEFSPGIDAYAFTFGG